MSEPEDLASRGYFLLPIPRKAKYPPPAGWVDRKEPFEIPADSNVAIGVRGDVAILITNDERSTAWASEQFSLPNVRSVRGGHWYFRAREGQANEANKLTPVGMMEFHVRNKYALIPPSIHPSGATYQWVRPLIPVAELAEAPDLRDLWNPGGAHHARLLSMSAAAAHAGENADSILAQLTTWRNGHLPDPQAHPDRELQEMAKSAFDKFHAETEHRIGEVDSRPPEGPVLTDGPSATDSKDGNKPSRRFESYFELPDGRIAEEILSPSGPVFLVYTPDPECWVTTPTISVDGEEVFPIPVPAGLRGALTLPSGVEEYGSTLKLLTELETWGLGAYDPGREGPIFRLWVRLSLGSWLLDSFYRNSGDKYAPVLPTIGPPESGKGRLLLVLRFFTYRSLYLLKTTRVPSIFRALEGWNGTLILDEADLGTSTEASEFVEFLNARAYGVPIIRYSTEGARMTYFSNFGLTVLAVRKAYEDAGFNSRTVPMHAEVTTKVFDIDLVAAQDWIDRGRTLLRKLLLWRLRHIHQIRTGKLQLPTRAHFPKVEAFRARTAVLPLLALSNEEPEISRDLEDLVAEIQSRVVTDRADSPEGILLGFIHDRLGAEGFETVQEGQGYKIEEARIEGREEDGPIAFRVPLTARGVSEALGKELPIRTVTRIWRAMGQTVKARARYPEKLYSCLLVISNPDRLEREFARFVPDAQPKTDLFRARPSQSTLTDPLTRVLPEQAEHPEQTSQQSPLPASSVQLVQDVQPGSVRTDANGPGEVED